MRQKLLALLGALEAVADAFAAASSCSRQLPVAERP